jgi:UDP-N-acetylglucosamine--N-acetylmuramyl-(pentapeptide) pyrophosphoryl-undecaprenol N-acetylglucosamine transferase
MSRTQTAGVRAIIAGGGTGGHVFPGIAVASALHDRGAQVLFVGTARGLEATAVPSAGFTFQTIPARQVRGGGITRAVAGAVMALWAIVAALRIIVRFRPRIVVGVGGYASAPMVVAAWLARVPTVLLEQNVIPGATNRLLGRFARRVCVSFPETATSFAGTRVVCTGNPVRAAVLTAARDRAACAEGPNRSGALTVLVVGGSAGAHHLNVEVVKAIERLAPPAGTLRIHHQTGAADAESTRTQYAAAGVDADVQAFFSDMADLYAVADVAVCRAGATTIAELLTVGVPAILVPYPYAADDHQRRNAEAVTAVGAGVLILDRELSGEGLAETLAALLADASRRSQMAAAARSLARPEAAQLVAEECVAMVAAHGGGEKK